MAEEVKVDPGLGAPPLLAAKDVAVEGTGGVEVADVVGEVEKAAHVVEAVGGEEETDETS